jgi:hypothetical protein
MPSAEQKESQMPLETPVPPPAAAKAGKGDTDKMKRPPAAAGGNGGSFTMPPQIQVDHVNGIWRVTKHGRFYGDFLKEQHASSAGEEAAGVAAPPS